MEVVLEEPWLWCMSPLEAYTMEDRKAIVKIQSAARARKARGEVNERRRLKKQQKELT